MRTRTTGILCDRSGERTVNKQCKGERVFARIGKVSQDCAEVWLKARQAEVDAESERRREHERREGAEQLFAAAAQKYLIECKQRGVRTLDVISHHVTILLPHIGSLPLRDVCNDALEGFKDERVAEGAKNATINRSLEVVRTVLFALNCGARDDNVCRLQWAWLLGHALTGVPQHYATATCRASGGGGQQGARDARPNHAAAGGQWMR